MAEQSEITRMRIVAAVLAFVGMAVLVWVMAPRVDSEPIDTEDRPDLTPPEDLSTSRRAQREAGREQVREEAKEWESTGAPARPGEALGDDAEPVEEAPAEPEVPPLGFLWGVVRDTDGEVVERAFVRGEGAGCDLRVAAAVGQFSGAALPGLCRLTAYRSDGAFVTASEPVDVEVIEGIEIEVDLWVPVERRGGLGVFIGEHDRGVAVQGVVPGTPAEDAGLVAGDVIVEVDGVDAAELALEEFQERMTGPEGTLVDFVVAWEGDTGVVEEPVVIRRQVIDRP